MKAPIQSRKHYFQIAQSTVAQAAIVNTVLCSAIEGARSQPQHVAEGALVKAVWLEVWCQQDSASVVGSFTAGFYKNPGGTNVLLSADAAAIHDYDNKKNLFYTTQALSPINDSGLMLLHKGWIKIPKGKQRMGLGDELTFFIRNNNATAIDIDFCGLAVYKEYT